MKRIGITQRVVYEEKVNERRDVLDQSWYAFASKIGIQLYPIPNAISSPIDYTDHLQLDGVIFSGGNNVSENKSDDLDLLMKEDVAIERDKTETELLQWAVTNQKPVIGICRGMQLICTFFGGKLSDVEPGIHVAKEHEVSFLEQHFSNIFGDKRSCNSYHRKGILIDDLPEEIVVAGRYKDEAEAVRHNSHPIFGMMWHPERYTSFREEDIFLFSKIFNASQKT
ncbi:hypothetical protein DYD21_01405 [Rhodohalobacter sp. SW132]|uniref:gamma-glutamyl-gamma-aminobutyrate hydrolase family protein n=1 Tax=Rhodohalobacter sp. SW132 TaxID=2293433 RepID=UPI000E261A81|nr:gamma-glutamyl-gamma-aminobutyrate hydrolase family protein [Rhodohalobacter sp. SW132]REL38633.1 hypothetical protein DYD21_01405 [Rhodohalobacter sp. SW132]